MKSNAMELVGFQRGMDYLKSKELEVGLAVTDNQLAIGAWIKKEHKEVYHFIDPWHVVKCKCVSNYPVLNP